MKSISCPKGYYTRSRGGRVFSPAFHALLEWAVFDVHPGEEEPFRESGSEPADLTASNIKRVNVTCVFFPTVRPSGNKEAARFVVIPNRVLDEKRTEQGKDGLICRSLIRAHSRASSIITRALDGRTYGHIIARLGRDGLIISAALLEN